MKELYFEGKYHRQLFYEDKLAWEKPAEGKLDLDRELIFYLNGRDIDYVKNTWTDRIQKITAPTIGPMYNELLKLPTSMYFYRNRIDFNSSFLNVIGTGDYTFEVCFNRLYNPRASHSDLYSTVLAFRPNRSGAESGISLKIKTGYAVYDIYSNSQWLDFAAPDAESINRPTYWHAIRKNGILYCYINGEEKAKLDFPSLSAPLNNTAPLSIGGVLGYEALNGYVYYVKIHKRALSQEDIDESINRMRKGFEG